MREQASTNRSECPPAGLSDENLSSMKSTITLHIPHSWPSPREIAALAMAAILHLSCGGRTLPGPDESSVVTDRDSLAVEVRRVLSEEFSLWYPRCIDSTMGGFFSDLDARWRVRGSQQKMIVTQARHVWSIANAVRSGVQDSSLLSAAAHGVRWLQHAMWDKDFGGFYDLVERDGTPVPEEGGLIKRAYGNAFAIYGLAAYTRATGDRTSLALAQEAFRWLEWHSYDRRFGGYFQFMRRDGTPLREGYGGVPPKDQNSSIHLLESFTELYRVWPNDTLRVRLASLFRIVRDTITTDRGTMVLFFREDWTPASPRDSVSGVEALNGELHQVSFGHDIETAYLLLEASEALGYAGDSLTLQVARRMVGQTLRFGWDERRGGFFDGGYYPPGADHPEIIRHTKEWWAQAEALNALLMMADLFPSAPEEYYRHFCLQWHYCKTYLLDPDNGGWYWGGLDQDPGRRGYPKATIWKGNYHTSRSLIHCLRRLSRLAPATTPEG